MPPNKKVLLMPNEISLHDTPRAAYAHVPFCNHRCGYCNFTVISRREDLTESYLQAIEQELRWLESPRIVQSLFIGGGTPTELAAADLKRLLTMLADWFPRTQDYEYSVEANPESLDEARTDVLVTAGVNRVSLGIQSFDDTKLASLDRKHSADAARQAIMAAQRAFENVSIDLMFAAPNESLNDWKRDLKTAIDLGPQHISTYGLTYEQGTRFWGELNKNRLCEVDDELQRAMFEWAIDALTDAGYEHYEVSNFAQPSYRCRHNETYWRGQPYFAVGPGASRYTDGRRETNHRSTTTYLRRVLAGESPVMESEELNAEDRARERLVFGLRRLDGVNVDQFVDETGISPETLAGGAIARYLDLGMLEQSDGVLRLTRAGLFVSDCLWPDFL